MAYVPPHLRNKGASASKGTLGSMPPSASPGDRLINSPRSQRQADEPDLRSQKEIYYYFWKDTEKSLDTKHSTTLHGTPDNPDDLGYVLLFEGANPRWASKNVIYVKSNLDLLPAIKQSDDRPESATASKTEGRNAANAQRLEGEPVEHAPFAVFEQPDRGYPTSRCFKFVGWYRVSRLELLEPRSEALIIMLSKKWEIVDKFGNVRHKKRGADGWERSMQHKWAVVKMSLDDEAMKVKGIPQIEKLEDELVENEREGKSVNELLQEMRIGGSASNKNDRTKEKAEGPGKLLSEGGLSLDEDADQKK